MRLSNLLTALLKEIVNSAKKSIVRRRWWSVHTHAKPSFLRYGYFSADCLTVICFKIFKSFRYYPFFNKPSESTPTFVSIPTIPYFIVSYVKLSKREARVSLITKSSCSLPIISRTSVFLFLREFIFRCPLRGFLGYFNLSLRKI